MAKKMNPTSRPKILFKGYLRVNLSEEQEAEFDEWFPLQSIQIDNFGILCNNGYKFSLSWDSFHDGVSAALFANDSKLAWSGWTLTAWAETPDEAIGLLFFKHYKICNEDWEHFYDVIERLGRKRG